MFFTKCTISCIISTPCLCTNLFLKVSHYFLYALAHKQFVSRYSCDSEQVADGF
jgi:hypothetical protein